MTIDDLMAIWNYVVEYWKVYTALGLIILFISFIKPIKMFFINIFSGFKEIFTWSGFFIFIFLVIFWIFFRSLIFG